MLLLDEPLGALDLKLRQEMQIELKPIQQEVGITFVYVTHDQEEALTMSDRIAVFNEGRIEQIGPPAEVYEHPQSEFIAGFVGVSNVIERDGPPLHGAAREDRRPRRRRAPQPGAHVEEGIVRDVQYVGPVTRYHVTLDRGGELQVLAQNLEEGSSEVLATKGRRVRLQWRPEQESAIVEQGGKRHERAKAAHGRAGGLLACWSACSRSSRQAAAATTRRREHWQIEGLGSTLEEIQANARRRARSTSSSGPATRRSSTSSGGDRLHRSTRRTPARGDDMISLIQSGEYDGVSASGTRASA